MSDMSRVEQVFYAALEKKSPAERLAFLDEACQGSPELRQAVERLLAAHDAAGSFLDRPPSEVLPTVDQSSAPVDPSQREGADLIGASIGPYKLLEVIGDGGMGVVYMADQHEPIRRRVALKVIKPGLDTRQVVARFEAERQALALMDHPNIARVFDAGTTAAGRPYFVMELVRGVPITDYCDRNKLPVPARLELFIQVCQAVQHAHQKGIIHRDIKPTNVLVTLHDGRPVPKVIDFGVAKAINQQLTEKTLFTNFAQMVGTPLYMSPEQAEMSGLDIDTRTDIYSLGVLLYELLTGTTPFDRETLRKAGYDEMRRIIREQEPVRPSTRISSADNARTVVAANRQVDPVRLGQIVRGDLDWIVMKSLEKDRQRRYESASGLAADVTRYLTHQPVEAGPPSAVYRFRKFARRNRAMLATASALLFALVLGVAASTWQAVRATKAERLADEQTTHAQSSEQTALREKQRAEEKTQEAIAERERAEQKTQEAHAATLSEREQKERNQRLLYVADINLAQQAWKDSQIPRLNDLLARHEPADGDQDARGWEWQYQRQQLHAELRTLNAKQGAVRCVTFHPNGATFATGGADGTIKIWASDTCQELNVMKGRPDDVRFLTFSSSGELLACAGEERVTVWDMTLCRVRWMVDVPDPLWVEVAFSRDGQQLTIASVDDSQPMNISIRNVSVSIFESATGKKLESRDLECTNHDYGVLRPDGQQVTLWDPRSSPSVLKLHDIATGRRAHFLRGHQGAVASMAFCPDCRTLATVSDQDGAIKVWDLETGAERKSFVEPLGSSLALTFTNDGRRLASTIGGSYGASSTGIRIWDVESGSEVRTLRGHTGAVSSIAFNPQGNRLVSGSVDGAIKVWDVGIPKAPRGLAMNRNLIFSSDLSPDISQLAIGQISGEILIWNVDNGELVHVLHNHTAAVHNLNFSPDGHKIVSAAQDGLVTLWDAESGSLLRSIRVGGERTHIAGTTRIAGPKDELTMPTVAFSPDGRYIIAGAYEGLKSMSVETLETEWSQSINSLGACYSPTGDLIASTVNNGIFLRDAETGKHSNFHKAPATVTNPFAIRRDRHLPAFPRAVNWEPPECLVFRNDGRLLASATSDATIWLWDVDTCRPLRPLKGHLTPPSVMTFSQDGRRLVSAAGATIKIWDVDSGAEVYSISRQNGECRLLRFSPDGKRLITLIDNRIDVFDATPRADDEKMGRAVVDELFDEYVLTDEVIAKVNGMTAWTPALRNAASAYANSRRSSLKGLCQTAWGMIVSTKSHPEYLQNADRIALAILTQEPHNAEFERLLACVRLKAGEPEEALKILASSRHDESRGLLLQMVAHLTLDREHDAQRIAGLLRESPLSRQPGSDVEFSVLGGVLDIVVGPYLVRAHEAFNKGEWAAAADKYSLARSFTSLGYGHVRLWCDALAMCDRWQEAADVYRRFPNLEDNFFVPWTEALLRLAAGDEIGYRNSCASLYRKYGNNPDSQRTFALASVGIIGPSALEDMAPVLALAQKAVDSDPRNPAHWSVLGAAQFRCGQFKESVVTLKKAIPMHALALTIAPTRAEEIQLSRLNAENVLAMAYHKLGDRESFDNQLAILKKFIADLEKSPPKPGSGVSRWALRFGILISGREMAKLQPLVEPPE